MQRPCFEKSEIWVQYIQRVNMFRFGMKKISSLEFAGCEEFEFDIYDEDQNIIHKKGAQITPGLLLQLNYKEIYKKDATKITANVKTTKAAPPPASVISEIATKSLLSNTRKILQNIMDDKQPDVSVCESTRDIVLDEVSEKIQKIDCIGQLRIFDEYTFSHTVNVSSMSSALGLILKLSEKELQDLALGALLHDIGKMKIPKSILHKPGKLTNEEFEEMKNHTTYGYEIITKEMLLPESIAKVALEHQEKYGGFGYPNGLKGDEISKFGHISAIADVYDALVSKRVYKEALPSHEAIKIMIADGSKCFNPGMLYKFIYLANFKNGSTLQVSNEQKSLAKIS